MSDSLSNPLFNNYILSRTTLSSPCLPNHSPPQHVFLHASPVRPRFDHFLPFALNPPNNPQPPQVHELYQHTRPLRARRALQVVRRRTFPSMRDSYRCRTRFLRRRRSEGMGCCEPTWCKQRHETHKGAGAEEYAAVWVRGFEPEGWEEACDMCC
jgi:hypothetical protein